MSIGGARRGAAEDPARAAPGRGPHARRRPGTPRRAGQLRPGAQPAGPPRRPAAAPADAGAGAGRPSPSSAADRGGRAPRHAGAGRPARRRRSIAGSLRNLERTAGRGAAPRASPPGPASRWGRCSSTRRARTSRPGSTTSRTRSTGTGSSRSRSLLGARGHVDLEFRVERDGRLSAPAHRCKSSGTAGPRSRGAPTPSSAAASCPCRTTSARPGRDAGLVLLQRGRAGLVTAPRALARRPRRPAPRWPRHDRRHHGPGRELPHRPAGRRRPASGCAAAAGRGVDRRSLPGRAASPPVVRVGILVDVAAGVDLGRRRDPRARGRRPPREAPCPRATFVAVATSAAGSRFRVQIASVTDESAARDIAGRGRGRPGSSRRCAGTRRRARTRCGSATSRTREEAQALAARLPAVGIAGGWVAEEPRDAAAGPPPPAGDRRRARRGPR